MQRPRFVVTIHLPPLPGSTNGGDASGMTAITDRAVSEATTCAEGGVEAVIIENFGDVPFRKDRVHPHTIAAMTRVVDAIRRSVDLPVGVNVLRNDVLSAVSIAAMTGAQFVRANVYVGASLTDQGIIEGQAETVQALIRRLRCDVEIWADVDVKHAAQIAPRPPGELALDAIERGMAAAVIVTGKATGSPASTRDLEAVRHAIGDAPLYVGSGATAATLAELLQWADGAIIGTAAKADGVVTNRVDPERLRELAAVIAGSRQS